MLEIVTETPVKPDIEPTIKIVKMDPKDLMKALKLDLTVLKKYKKRG